MALAVLGKVRVKVAEKSAVFSRWLAHVFFCGVIVATFCDVPQLF